MIISIIIIIYEVEKQALTGTGQPNRTTKPDTSRTEPSRTLSPGGAGRLNGEMKIDACPSLISQNFSSRFLFYLVEFEENFSFQ